MPFELVELNSSAAGHCGSDNAFVDYPLQRASTDDTTNTDIDPPKDQIVSAIPLPTLFDKLPVESLSLIFHFYVPSIRTTPSLCQSYAPIHSPLLLSHISHRFRSIALSLPTLWNRGNLGLDIRPELVKLFLERAGDPSVNPQPHFCCAWRECLWMSEGLGEVVGRLGGWEEVRVELDAEEFEDDDDDEPYLSGEEDEDMDVDVPLPTAGTRVENQSTTEAADDSMEDDLTNLPSIPLTAKATRLRNLELIVDGRDPVNNGHKTEWCINLINACGSALERLTIVCPSLQAPLPPIRWAGLDGLKNVIIETEDGIPIEDVVKILVFMPNIQDFSAQVMRPDESQLVNSSSSRLPRPNQRNLILPHLQTINLQSPYPLPSLYYLYTSIASAPKLDSLIVKSRTYWDHELFLKLLSNLPCPIQTLKIDLCDSPEFLSNMFQYLGHEMIEPSVRKLVIEGWEVEPGSWLALPAEFYQGMKCTMIDRANGTGVGMRTEGERRIVLGNLEHLELLNCYLPLGSGEEGTPLADMIMTRLWPHWERGPWDDIGVPKPERPVTRLSGPGMPRKPVIKNAPLKMLVVRSPRRELSPVGSGSQDGGPGMGGRDWIRLDRIRKMRPDMLGEFRWEVVERHEEVKVVGFEVPVEVGSIPVIQ